MSAEDTKNDNITESIDSKDLKIKDGQISKRVHTKKLPAVIIKNTDYLSKIEKFLRKEFNGDVFKFRDEVDEEEFEELTTIQELFDEFMEVIESFNNNEPFEISNCATKMNRLKKLASAYV